jgi:hypothetical protein
MNRREFPPADFVKYLFSAYCQQNEAISYAITLRYYEIAQSMCFLQRKDRRLHMKPFKNHIGLAFFENKLYQFLIREVAVIWAIFINEMTEV